MLCLMTASNDLPRVVTKREAAEILRVSPRTIDRMIADGQLRVTRPSVRATRIYESSIADLMEAGEAAAESDAAEVVVAS